jgi:hypothetical protein
VGFKELTAKAVSPLFRFNLRHPFQFANATISIRDDEEGTVVSLSMENNQMASSQKIKKQDYL